MQLVGRRSSVFTRLPLFLVEHLGVPCEFEPIPDMTVQSPAAYAGNPALKLPILRLDGDVVFGAQNICRVIAELAALAGNAKHIVWPEDLKTPLQRNAQELVWHAMAAQVQLVMGTVLGKLPADNMFFLKARTGLEASLDWLDQNVDAIRATLPVPRDLSLFELSLFCLVQHLVFRPTAAVESRTRLASFTAEFGSMEAARRTAYRFD
ncbi:MAG: glutathione S-transferase N-terminal domain-containing protein [Pseudomonadota bacterium]